MARKYTKREKVKTLPHLALGVNNRDASAELNDFEMTSCLNFEVNEKIIRTSAGIVDYGSVNDTTPVYGGFEGTFEDGTHIHIRQMGDVLQYDLAGTWTDTLATGLSEARCTFAMLNNTILWSNGIDSIKSSLDGIVWTTEALLPKCRKIMHNGKNRMLFIGQTDAKSRMDWSDINQPTTVGADSYQFIGKNDGGHLLDCVITDNGGLYLFKTHRVYAIGDVTMDMIGVDVVGSLDYIPFTAVATNNSVIALAFDGLYEIVGGTIMHISKNITVDTTTPKNTDTPVAIFFNNEYRVALPIDGDVNDVEVVVNRNQLTTVQGHPYPITFNTRNIGAYVTQQDESGVMKHRVYVGGSVDGDYGWINVDHNQGVTQGVFGEDQTCILETKYFTDDTAYYIKRFTRYFIDVSALNSVDIKLSYRFDPVENYLDATIPVNASQFLWSGAPNFEWLGNFGFQTLSSDRKFIDLEKNGVPRGIQFKIELTTSSDVSIYSQAYQYLTKPNFH